ncbi:MAG: NYN domain-containing protein [Candidatus Paceibacterota bacterium]|jgi:hypothetical protein
MFGKNKEESPKKQTVTLIDYRNLIEGLKAIGKNFPAEELKDLGRRYGIALTPRIYISHTVHFNTAMSLGRMGYVVVFCPPVKFNGPDTVDERIHEECRLLADHPQIDTFIIVSNDADFRKTEDLLRDHHKTVVRFRLEEKECLQKSGQGDIVHLPDTQKEEIFQEKNEFIELIERINKDGKDSLDKDKIWFLRQIVEACEKIHRTGEFSRSNAKSFWDLKNFVWQYIHKRASRIFNINDCHCAIDALVNHSDVIEQRQQAVHPRRYYVYNPNHSLPLY